MVPIKILPYFDKEALATEFPYFASNQIAITSETGCGSTSTLKELRDTLFQEPYRFLSGGSIMRAKAKNLGMTIAEFAEYNRTYPDEGHDIDCDRILCELAQHNFVIMEARLAHINMPQAFKVRLVCSATIRAKRRLKDRLGENLEEVAERIRKRDSDDNIRYNLLYPGCIWPDEDFDLIIDTGQEENTPAVVAEKILAAHQRWSSERTCNKNIVLS